LYILRTATTASLLSRQFTVQYIRSVASGIYPSDSEYKNRAIVTMQFRVQTRRVKCLAIWNKSFSFWQQDLIL